MQAGRDRHGQRFDGEIMMGGNAVAAARPDARPRKAGGLRALLVVAVATSCLVAGCDRTQTVQRGYRGTSAWQLYKPSAVEALREINQIPEAEDPADDDTPPVNEVFKNVRVLNDISSGEFSRLMQALSTWVAPEEGCEYCHNPKKLESDEKYTKIVARRMLQMTRDINTNWKTHVSETGVTCWTCHRGQAVPSGDWFRSINPTSALNTQANYTGKNFPAPNAGNSALPYDPLSTFLSTDAAEVRVQANQPLADGQGVSVKSAEQTYALMMYISQSLGVNCNYCHNTRALGRWDQSTPQRGTAWYGIRMVRTLNTSYLIPLQSTFPVNRLSAEGDGPKVGCGTCHKGTFKPLYGASSLKDYRVLAGVTPTPIAAATAENVEAAKQEASDVSVDHGPTRQQAETAVQADRQLNPPPDPKLK